MALSRHIQREPRNGFISAYTDEASPPYYVWRHLSIEKLNDGFSRITKRMDYSTALMR